MAVGNTAAIIEVDISKVLLRVHAAAPGGIAALDLAVQVQLGTRTAVQPNGAAALFHAVRNP